MINFLDTNIYNLILKMYSIHTTYIMLFISHLGSAVMLILMCVVFVVLEKTRKISLKVFLNLGGAYLLNSVIKIIVARPRPHVLQLVYEDGYSFPSGHAMVSTAFYGFLIYIVYKNIKNKTFKNSIISLLSLLIVLIGISRIYLGVHYATDVIGGVIIGIIYLVLFIKIVNKVEPSIIKNEKIKNISKKTQGLKNKTIKNKVEKSKKAKKIKKNN